MYQILPVNMIISHSIIVQTRKKLLIYLYQYYHVVYHFYVYWVIKENNTSHLAIEETENDSPIKNEQIYSGVLYDSSLENTLSNMKNQKRLLEIE